MTQIEYNGKEVERLSIDDTTFSNRILLVIWFRGKYGSSEMTSIQVPKG